MFFKRLRQQHQRKPRPFRKPHNRWYLVHPRQRKFYISVQCDDNIDPLQFIKKHRILPTHWCGTRFMLLGTEDSLVYLCRKAGIKEIRKLELDPQIDARTLNKSF